MLDTDHSAPAQGADLPRLLQRSERSPRPGADFVAARDGKGLTQREFSRRARVPRTELHG